MHFRISKGVTALTYDAELNLIATGSSDNRVRVWNPHVMKKSMAVLKGHTCAVTFMLSRVSEHQVIRYAPYIDYATSLVNIFQKDIFS